MFRQKNILAMKLLSAAATAVLLVSAEAFAPVLPVSGRVGTSAMHLRMAGQKVRVRSLSHVLFVVSPRLFQPLMLSSPLIP